MSLNENENEEFEERLKKFDEQKDKESKEKLERLDKEWPLEERILDVAEMKARERTAKELTELEEYKLAGKSRENKISWPSPLAESAYHGIAGEFVRTIEPHTESDPVAILISFLTAFGSIIGSRPYFQVEAAKHRTRVFTVLVGDTSKARKGTSWDYIRNIFETIDENWKWNIQTGLSSGEGLIWAVRDEIVKRQPTKESGQITGYQNVIEDEGIKDKRLLVVESEFASTLRVIGREGNTLSPVVRKAWDTGDLQTLTKNSPAKATGAHISIVGHITQDELLRYLTSTETGNGFGNRFLFVCVRRSKELPHGGNIQSVDFSPLVNKLREAVEFAKGVDRIEWDKETYSLWAKIYHNLSESKHGLVGALTARAEAYVCRLACIYALLDRSILIKPEHLKAAIAVWDYTEASVKYIFQGKIGDPIANKIIEALTNHPEGMARTDISYLFGRNVDSDQLSISLDSLLNLGRIKSEIIQTEGRSKELFSLNSFNSYSSSVKTHLEVLETYIVENGNLAVNNNKQTNEKNEISKDQPLPKQTSQDEQLIQDAEKVFGVKGDGEGQDEN